MDIVMSQASKGQECVGRATRIVMIPSASGGIGHSSRTAALARALRRLDPAAESTGSTRQDGPPAGPLGLGVGAPWQNHRLHRHFGRRQPVSFSQSRHQ